MRYLAILLVLIWPLASLAQDGEEDRGFLVGLLEDSLGGDGRTVRIFGFAGALSSRATIERVTISDSEGDWLTMEDVAMQWNRRALFRAAIDIQELRAGRIELTRLPVSPQNDLPTPEATPFALPELPASISIAQLELAEVVLGAPVLGEAATLSVSGTATLANGAGDTRISATRTDVDLGVFEIAAAYVNSSRDLTVDLKLREGAGGLVSGILNIPERPSVDLTVSGAGPLSDFGAKLNLRTDDTPRLSGTLALQNQTDGPMAFDAALDGDVSALFLQQYRAFFGTDVALTARGRSDSEGALSLDAFALETRALKLAGRAELNSDAWPTLLDIEGTLADPDGAPLLLPGNTRISRASIAADFDADQSDSLVARIDVAGLEQPDAAVDLLSLRFDGTLNGAVGTIGALAGRLNIDASGVSLSDPGLARAVGTALSGGFDLAYADDAPLVLDDMTLASAAWALTGQAQVSGFDAGFETEFETALVTQDLSAFAELVGLDLAGAGDLAMSGKAALGGLFDVDLRGQTRDLALGVAQADPLLAGQTDLNIAARRDTTGTFVDSLTLANPAIELTATANLRTDASVAQFNAVLADVGQVTDAVSGPLTVDGTATQTGEIWEIAAGLSGPLGGTATGTARIAPDGTQVALDASVDDLSPLVPQIQGGAQLTAKARQIDGIWQFESDLGGPADIKAEVTGQLDGAKVTARYDVAVPAIQSIAPGVSGAATLQGNAARTAEGWEFDTQVTGPYRSSGTVSGKYTDRLTSDFDLRLPDVGTVAQGMNGQLALKGTFSQTDDGWQAVTDIAGPYSSTGRLSASLKAGLLGAGYALTLPNVASLVPGLAGRMTVNGTASQIGSEFDIVARIEGPSGATATADGRVRGDGTVDLSTRGQMQLGLANRFIAPRTIVGTADFDLAINGTPALQSVSGQISTRGAQLATPSLPVSVSDLSGVVRMAGGQATLDFTGALSEGGNVAITGPITLSGSYPAQLAVALNGVILRDPQLYSTTVNGEAALRGPLTGGAAISGQMTLGETDIRVPSTGFSTFGAVPNITHIGATRPVMRTRERAGLTQSGASATTSSAYPLDIQINAPNRIFIRGRGIDAEMGGQLRLTGTTADMISTGQFELIRGRIDVLTKRFDLTEGRVALQGRFEPILRLVAETPTAVGSARIIVDGPADDPEVTFEATPDAPEDQVLAQIFFGRDITQLSAFQALQLAEAVANLAGQGGEGTLSRLRGAFSLDDLDVTSDEEGNTAVRAGKYISDNVYTDVTVGGADGPEVSLNIDLTPNITARGTVGADANTGIGIFIEKDY